MGRKTNGVEDRKIRGDGEMRIMLVIGALSFGGAERVMANIANYLAERHQVLLCTLFERETPYQISEKVSLKQGLAAHGKIASFQEIRKTAKEYKPDVALSFLTQINITTIISLFGTNIPVVVSERNDPNFEPAQKYRKILRKIVFPLAAGYVFQTEDAKTYFSHRIQKKGIVIPNPVFVEDEIKPIAVPDSKKEFVAVGRLTPQKNYSLLIKSFSKVAKSHPEFILKIYGEGELKEELSDEIKQTKSDSNIFLMGASKTIHYDIVQSYGFIMSSDHEGMPNALLEAMALGLCCISTDCPCGGPREIIESTENGLLVPVADVKAMETAIIKVIEDSVLAEKMSMKARETKEKYSLEVIGKKWEQYLVDICKTK